MNRLKLRQMLQSFLIEDIGDKDLTSESIFPVEQIGRGNVIAKESGIIAGLEIIKEAYDLLDPSIYVDLRYVDGDKVFQGDILAEISGPVVYLLTGERVVLNLIQRMSGIATITQQAVVQLNDSSIQICDTRKTTPGLRMLEKYAVFIGGGQNHRFALDDGVMIKDNHISFAGSITKAVETARENIGHMVKVEVETETKAEVIEAVSACADVIMFDNRTPEEIEELNVLVPNHIITEASGGIVLDSLEEYANTGVDYISLGFITHSVSVLDISLTVKTD